jgi:hypothetical protein
VGKAFNKGNLVTAFGFAAIGVAAFAERSHLLNAGRQILPPMRLGVLDAVAIATSVNPLISVAAVAALSFTARKIGTALYIRQDATAYPSPPGTKLTAGEIDFAKSIFGEGVRTRGVKIYLSPKENDRQIPTLKYPGVGAEVVGGKRIKFYGPRLHSEDFSSEKDPAKRTLFAHEMTHVWQKSRGNLLGRVFNKFARLSPAYFYELSPNSKFKNFGIEQQASLIEDYTAQFLTPTANNGERSNLYEPSNNPASGISAPQPLALLQKVVEDRFPEARKTRIKMEGQKKAPVVPQPQL